MITKVIMPAKKNAMKSAEKHFPKKVKVGYFIYIICPHIDKLASMGYQVDSKVNRGSEAGWLVAARLEAQCILLNFATLTRARDYKKEDDTKKLASFITRHRE